MVITRPNLMKTLTMDRFNLFDTIESGQTFTWIREGNGYVNADLGQVIYVEQRGDTLFYESSSHPVDLVKLFRLEDPLAEIQAEITQRGLLQESIDFAPNLRIVSDPLVPCLISFIGSIQKNIPGIHTCMLHRGKTDIDEQHKEKVGSIIQLQRKDILWISFP